jgi:hypothetical protein
MRRVIVDHNYYLRAPSINRQVWDFLAQHALAGDPRHQNYNYARSR